MRSQLIFNELQEQSKALRHAPLTNIQKSLQRIFATLCFVRSFFGLFIFVMIYFAHNLFDYLFQFLLYIFVYLIKMTI